MGRAVVVDWRRAAFVRGLGVSGGDRSLWRVSRGVQRGWCGGFGGVLSEEEQAVGAPRGGRVVLRPLGAGGSGPKRWSVSSGGDLFTMRRHGCSASAGWASKHDPGRLV